MKCDSLLIQENFTFCSLYKTGQRDLFYLAILLQILMVFYNGLIDSRRIFGPEKETYALISINVKKLHMFIVNFIKGTQVVKKDRFPEGK